MYGGHGLPVQNMLSIADSCQFQEVSSSLAIVSALNIYKIMVFKLAVVNQFAVSRCTL